MSETEDPAISGAKPPRFSGFIDDISDGKVQGWAVDGENPERPVSLIVLLDDAVVGEVTTSVERADIVRMTGAPVKAGFRFGFSGISLNRAETLLNTLDGAKDPDANIVSRISLRYGDDDTDARLGLSLNKPFADVETAVLRDILVDKAEKFRKNFVISERRQFFLDNPVGRKTTPDVKVVAFYLPQYHPIPENDEWWGPGFTEWTNVASAKPYYKDHQQPRRPGGLGYYDLRSLEVQEQQVELAKEFGVSAFCYYHYWFSGKTLLDMPVKRHVEKDLDLDFCLCWANENWTRRWDGSEDEVLQQQQHSEDNDISFIDEILPYFESDRYIKIDGAPLLIIYRATLLSNPETVFAEWKRRTKALGYPDLHISVAETFNIKGPDKFSADSSVQFPPHNIDERTINDRIDDLDRNFTGKIFNYADVVVNELKRPAPSYTRYNTAMCAWDNTSRKGAAGDVFHGATPELFQAWLSHLVAQARRTQPESKRLVFVNAWNEWAEGSYLEPDRTNGYDYLHSVRNALSVQGAVSGELFDPESPVPEDLRQKLETLVGTLRDSSEMLAEAVIDLGIETRFPSPFVPTAMEELGYLQSNPGAMCRVDAIQNLRANGGNLTLLREEKVTVEGWIDIPGTKITEFLPMYVALRSVNAGSRTIFLSSINYRKIRTDALTYRGYGVNETQLNGFSFVGDMKKVDPGRYQFRVLVAQGGNSVSFTDLDTNWTVDIG